MVLAGVCRTGNRAGRRCIWAAPRLKNGGAEDGVEEEGDDLNCARDGEHESPLAGRFLFGTNKIYVLYSGYFPLNIRVTSACLPLQLASIHACLSAYLSVCLSVCIDMHAFTAVAFLSLFNCQTKVSVLLE